MERTLPGSVTVTVVTVRVAEGSEIPSLSKESAFVPSGGTDLRGLFSTH